MPTKKKRINVTLQKETALFLEKIAVRDDVPQATKASELLEFALELLEDEYFSKVADARLQSKEGFISHREFWKSA